jgi:hypothetical protein
VGKLKESLQTHIAYLTAGFRFFDETYFPVCIEEMVRMRTQLLGPGDVETVLNSTKDTRSFEFDIFNSRIPLLGVIEKYNFKIVSQRRHSGVRILAYLLNVMNSCFYHQFTSEEIKEIKDLIARDGNVFKEHHFINNDGDFDMYFSHPEPTILPSQQLISLTLSPNVHETFELISPSPQLQQDQDQKSAEDETFELLSPSPQLQQDQDQKSTEDESFEQFSNVLQKIKQLFSKNFITEEIRLELIKAVIYADVLYIEESRYNQCVVLLNIFKNIHMYEGSLNEIMISKMMRKILIENPLWGTETQQSLSGLHPLSLESYVKGHKVIVNRISSLRHNDLISVKYYENLLDTFFNQFPVGTIYDSELINDRCIVLRNSALKKSKMVGEEICNSISVILIDEALEKYPLW